MLQHKTEKKMPSWPDQHWIEGRMIDPEDGPRDWLRLQQLQVSHVSKNEFIKIQNAGIQYPERNQYAYNG